MKKVLIVHYSRTGYTEKMAEFIAEGIRFSGNQATIRKVSDMKKATDIDGYDGYLFGSPTFYQTIAEPMKTFLFLAEKADLKGKLAGAFGSYSHEGNAPGMVLDTMQYIFNMEPFDLGALKLKEHELAIFDSHNPATAQSETMKACQQYGKAFGEKLAN